MTRKDECLYEIGKKPQIPLHKQYQHNRRKNFFLKTDAREFNKQEQR